MDPLTDIEQLYSEFLNLSPPPAETPAPQNTHDLSSPTELLLRTEQPSIMQTARIFNTDIGPIDPSFLDISAGFEWAPTWLDPVILQPNTAGPDESELAGEITNLSIPSLPEVGTYIPIVDGPEKPEYLLPEGHPLELTETAQLALDLSTYDNSISWLDDLFELPVNHPWWTENFPSQPLPTTTLSQYPPIPEPFWTYPSYNENAYQPVNPFEGLDNSRHLSVEGDAAKEVKKKKSKSAGTRGGKRGTLPGKIKAGATEHERKRLERRRLAQRRWRARQRKAQGDSDVEEPVKSPRQLKKNDPVHQAKMKERKNARDKIRRERLKAEREATRAGLAEAAGHPEASTRKTAKARADKRKQVLPGQATKAPTPLSQATAQTNPSKIPDQFPGIADAGDKKGDQVKEEDSE